MRSALKFLEASQKVLQASRAKRTWANFKMCRAPRGHLLTELDFLYYLEKGREHTLETGALVGELADAVEDEVDNFFADGVVATGVVVGGVFLACVAP